MEHPGSRNKKIQSEISTNSCVVQGSTSTIGSLSNFNIRIADIVMIPRARSTYFLFSHFPDRSDWDDGEVGILWRFIIGYLEYLCAKTKTIFMNNER